MNTTLYHEKIRNLRNEGTFDDKLLSAFTQWMIKAEDWDLFRINPVKLAASLELPEPSMIDFFVHGSRVGLFDFSWSMICPSCGEIQNNDHSLNALEGEFHCVVCQAPVQVNIDDTVEVTFTLNPAIRSLNLDPFKDAGTYRAAFFSAAVDRSPAILEYMNTIWVGFEAIPPQETLIIDRTWKRGKSYRFVSAGVHSQFVFHVDPEASDVQEIYPVDFGENGMSPEELTIKSTNGQFRIQNRRYDTVGLMMVEADFPKLHALMKSHPGKMLPMLTGNQLLSNQKFRELFKMQNLSPALRLNIRSLTLLFTDLKGSTELYDRTGDVDAYNLIQEHFKLLEKNMNKGCIILADNIISHSEKIDSYLTYVNKKYNSITLSIGSGLELTLT